MYKSLTEATKGILGISYYNGKTKRLLQKYLEENNLTIPDIIESKKCFCLNCGKQIPKRQKFCSRNCSASYTNKGKKMKEETKQKIRAAILKRRKQFPRNKSGRKLYTNICNNCGAPFTSIRIKQRYCSQKCANSSEETKQKLKDAQQKLINLGIHAGWQKRNITSYAEKFWEQVLNNNNISYKREDHSTKHYFLDFLIEKNGKKIDLEIDGKQHNYKDRKAHDKARDAYLTQKGYIVYRIKWNSLLSEIGKSIMKEKIDDFLAFYNNI